MHASAPAQAANFKSAVEFCSDLKPAFILFLVLHIREIELDEVKHLLARSMLDVTSDSQLIPLSSRGPANSFPALFRHEVAERLFKNRCWITPIVVRVTLYVERCVVLPEEGF